MSQPTSRRVITEESLISGPGKTIADSAYAKRDLSDSDTQATLNAAIAGGIADDLATPRGQIATAVGPRGYLVGCFTGNTTQQMSLTLAWSPDGVTIYPSVNGPSQDFGHTVRDPDIMGPDRSPDGRWWGTWTVNGGGDKVLAVAASTDLLTWVNPATGDPGALLVDVSSTPDLNEAWAPSWVVADDGTVSLLYSRYGDPGTITLRPYYVTATDSSLTTWGAPTALSTGGDTGSIIDPYVIADDGVWRMFFGRDPAICRATSTTSPLGPYVVDKTGDWTGNWSVTDPANGDLAFHFEGPCVIRLPDGRWRVYADCYSGTPGVDTIAFYGIHYADGDTADGPFPAFAPITMAPGMPSGDLIRHGVVVPVNDPQENATALAGTVAARRVVRYGEYDGGGSADAANGWIATWTVNARSQNPPAHPVFTPKATVMVDVPGIYAINVIVQMDGTFDGGYIGFQINDTGYNDAQILLPATDQRISLDLSNIRLEVDDRIRLDIHPTTTRNFQLLKLRLTQIA